MKIVVGHANPDFDAYASTVAATKLFPGSRGVFLGSQNANVRAFHNLHEEFLDFIDLRSLDLDSVDSVVMVDTRDPGRVGELRDVVLRPGMEVVVYDHHPAQEGDIEGADDRSVEVGATTSILVHEIRHKGIELAPLEASLMLLGIHEDTGSLTYPGATAYDADAAAYLMAACADMEVLNQFLSRVLDDDQRRLLAQLQDTLETWDINGHQVAVGFAEADQYVDSAGVLTHYVVEDMGFRVAIGIVKMPERTQVVARSRLSEVDVGAVMARLGGGGHAQAASAGFRSLTIDEAIVRVREALVAEVRPPLRAGDIMSSPVRTIGVGSTMREAGDVMSRWGHGGLPIVDGGRLVGMVSRKDVDKAVRHGLDHAPVTGFMGRELVTVGPDADLQELERLLATRGVGRVPVMEEERLIGIVTRKDVLRSEYGDAYLDRRLVRAHPQATQRFLGSVESLLPADVRELVETLGEHAARVGVRAHLVGGFVRDMLLGRRNLDLDIVIEGDGVAFAESAAQALGVRARVHRRFGTAVLVLGRDFHVDVASSRSEYYTKPGALPTVERSTLRQDLLRRDFTINAMAACIDPGCKGQIADPFNGLRDLEQGAIRVLHALSFIDDPTRLLRAARFETRYGFRMTHGTEQLARRAVDLRVLEEISGARIRDELLDVLDEGSPDEVFARLHDLRTLEPVLPEGVSGQEAVEALHRTDAALRHIGDLVVRKADRRAALVAAVASLGGRERGERWVRHLRFGRAFSESAYIMTQRGAALMRALQDRRGMRDSRLFHMLAPLPSEALVILWATGDELVRERIERFLRTLCRLRPSVSGRDLIAMGAQPGQGFSDILARARDDRLDGRAVGRDAELANLRRLAQRAGLI